MNFNANTGHGFFACRQSVYKSTLFYIAGFVRAGIEVSV